MTINPGVRYPAKTTTPSAAFPYGGPQDIAVTGDGTGTPWTAAVISDLWALIYKLLDAAGITPNNAPDTVAASQVWDALMNSELFSNDAISDVSAAKITSGTMTLTTSFYTIAVTATGITISNSLDASSLELKAGTGASEASIVYTSGDSGLVATLDSTGFEIEDAAGTAYQLKTRFTGGGIAQSGGPGVVNIQDKRTEGFSASSLSWSVDAGTARIYYNAIDLTLTGIPWGSPIYHVDLTFTDTSGSQVVGPVNGVFKDVAGTTTLDSATYLGGVSPTGGTSPVLLVTYGAAAVD